MHGDNTDVEGFRRALRTFLEGPTAGTRVLLLGAGGAARAALAALVEDGVGEILLYNRTQERARAVARRTGGQKVRVVPVARELEGEDFDLVVNATRPARLGPPSPRHRRRAVWRSPRAARARAAVLVAPGNWPGN